MSAPVPHFFPPFAELAVIVDSSPGTALADHPSIQDMAAAFGMTPEAVARDVAHICRLQQCAKPGRPGRYLDLSAHVIEPGPTRPHRQ